MLSLLVWPKVITLSGFYCKCKYTTAVKQPFYSTFLSRGSTRQSGIRRCTRIPIQFASLILAKMERRDIQVSSAKLPLTIDVCFLYIAADFKTLMLITLLPVNNDHCFCVPRTCLTVFQKCTQDRGQIGSFFVVVVFKATFLLTWPITWATTTPWIWASRPSGPKPPLSIWLTTSTSILVSSISSSIFN